MNWQKINNIYSTRWSLIIATALTLVVFGLEESQTAKGTEPTLIGYAKAGPLKETVQKVTEVARKIQPSPQVESLPYMVGAMLGDPTLDSITATENITVFIYNTSANDEATYLVLAKLTEDSPIRNALSLQGVIVEDRMGWSLISRDQYLLEQIKNVESLIKLAEKKRGADIEIGFWLNRIKYPIRSIKHDIITRLERDGGIEDEEDIATVEGLIDIVIGELTSLDSLLMGLNFSAEAFVFQSNIKAKSETPLGNLFSQEPDREITVGEYLSTDNMLTYWVRFDPEVSIEYINNILNAVIGVSHEDWKSLMISLKGLYNRFLQGIDGTSAGSFELSKMTAKTEQIGGTNLNSNELAGLIEDGIKLADKFIFLLNKDNGVNITSMYDFRPNDFAVNGVAVHTLKSKFSFPGNPNSEESSEEENSLTNLTYYYAVSNGVYMSASNSRSINEIINQVTSGTPADRNLNTIFSFKKGMLAQFRFDLKRSLMMTAESLENINPEHAAAIREKIESAVMEPVSSELRIGNVRMIFRLKASWESMASWGAIMQMMNQGAVGQEIPAL